MDKILSYSAEMEKSWIFSGPITSPIGILSHTT